MWGVLFFFLVPSPLCLWAAGGALPPLSVSIVLQQWHVLTIQPDDFEPNAGSQEQEELIVS